MSLVSKGFLVLVVGLIIGGTLAIIGSYASLQSSSLSKFDMELKNQQNEIMGLTKELNQTLVTIQTLQNLSQAIYSEISSIQNSQSSTSTTLLTQNKSILQLQIEINNLTTQLVILQNESVYTMFMMQQINNTINLNHSQVNEIQNQVSNVSSLTNQLDQRISTLQNEIKNINDKISAIVNQLNSMEQQIQNLLKEEHHHD